MSTINLVPRVLSYPSLRSERRENLGTRLEYDLIYSLSIYARFSGQFFFKSSYKRIVMGQKDRCAVLGCNNDRLFPEKYTVKFSFCPKSMCKYCASASGHPIILLKSNKFNMAAVSVERSFEFITLSPRGRCPCWVQGR